jgi:cellulose synthase/poly-beta-1,6-N-acetylglucosamine synthase-like glycosyltransferase
LILLVEFIPVMVNSIFFEYLLLFTRFVYLICAGVLFLYGLNCIILSSIYLINRKKIWSKSKLTNLVQKPIVSIQLPIYNEGRLVIGLLKHITQLDYPKEKLQIQVLDDSTDETRQLLKQLVLQYKDKGYWIEYAHRRTQTGYKAGNLAYGLEKAKGAFIVVFDADYEPNPDFLKKTLPIFSNSSVGFVQTRWTNKNLDTNIITYMGGITYDGHLFVEQNARSQGGLFTGFSGSAGIWRTKCLQSIDGWKWDTITEDIDASFRAQLKGWKGIYYPHALSKAELPDEMYAFKLQQNRWAKGSAQNFRKHIRNVLMADLPLKVKIMALFHLLSYVTVPAIPISLLLVLPLCLLGGNFIRSLWWMSLGGIGPAILFTIAQLEQKGNLRERLIHLPMALLMAVGISLDAFAGVTSGFFQRGGEFIRTPRVMESSNNIENEKKSLFLNNLTLAELVFSFYLIGSAYMLWPTSGKYMIPWLLSSAAGLFFMAVSSMAQFFSHQKKKLISQGKE